MFIKLTPKPKSSYNLQDDKVEYKQDRYSNIVLNSDHIVSIQRDKYSDSDIVYSIIKTLDGQTFGVNESVEVIYNMLNRGANKPSYQKY